MRYYIEVFAKDDASLDGCLETDLKPEQVAEAFGEHPVGIFELTPEMARRFELQGLDFQAKDFFLTAAREFEGEGYEHDGENLYPPPMFLPEIFNADPVRPVADER